MRVVREHFDKTRPGTLIMSEWGTDFQVPYINSVMIHSHAGFAVTPARVAFPELYWLPHYPCNKMEILKNPFEAPSLRSDTSLLKAARNPAHRYHERLSWQTHIL